MHEDVLTELGLTDNEVRIYLLLLERGMMNPAEMAERLGLHRGYLYDALERMQEKEIVNTILVANKKQYQATAPENLVELLSFRLKRLQDAIPDLNKLRMVENAETKVELHKGKRVYRTLLKDVIATMKADETLFLIGIDDSVLLNEVEPIYLRQYLNTIRERNIFERIIVKRGTMHVDNPNCDYRELDEQYIGKTMQLIYGDKIALFVMGVPHYLVLIENKETAETYRRQFELLWKVAT